jgi:hypothetical protein
MQIVKVANDDKSEHLSAFVAEAKHRGYAIELTPEVVSVAVPDLDTILNFAFAVKARIDRRTRARKAARSARRRRLLGEALLSI